MIRIVCDICLKHLPDAAQDRPQLCERCLPFAEEYYAGVQKLGQELTYEWQRRLERHRNQFLQQRVTVKQQVPLKAV